MYMYNSRLVPRLSVGTVAVAERVRYSTIINDWRSRELTVKTPLSGILLEMENLEKRGG